MNERKNQYTTLLSGNFNLPSLYMNYPLKDLEILNLDEQWEV